MKFRISFKRSEKSKLSFSKNYEADFNRKNRSSYVTICFSLSPSLPLVFIYTQLRAKNYLFS